MYISETYSEPSQTSFSKIFDIIQRLTIFAKCSMLHVAQGSKYAFDNTKYKPGAISFIS